jgi:hypothetical protein
MPGALRHVQRGPGLLKARRPVFRQVLTPRLPGPFPGNGCEKPNRRANHHDHRTTDVPAACGVRGFVFPSTRCVGQPESETRTSDSPTPAEGMSSRRRREISPTVRGASGQAQSVLVGLRDNGLELVPRRPSKGKVATQRQYAKIKLQAVKRDERVMNALGEGWHAHGVAARFVYAQPISGCVKPSHQCRAFVGYTPFGAS